MNETEKFCEYLTHLTWRDIPPDIASDVRYRVLDWFGCAVSALNNKTGKSFLDYARQNACDGKVPIVGLSGGFAPEMAGFVNGALGHVMEYDDLSKTAIGHPGCVVVPTALVACREYGCTMGEFLTAIVCGYEAYIRIGNAVCPSHYENWHTTGTIGAFAAAVTAAKIAHMSATGMQSVLGIVATTASGLISSFGTEAKIVTVGNAVRNGLTAVHLARAGVTGPMDSLEREGNFLSITCRDYDAYALLTNLGNPLLISTAGYKIYASCGHTHTVLDALFELVRENQITAEEVLTMKAEVYSVAGRITSQLKTDTELSAKFSLPYCMAAAVACGEVSLAQFSEKERQRSDILDLAKRVTVETNPAFDEGFPAKRTCRVVVNTTKGEYEQTLTLPVQIPNSSVLVKKFHSIVAQNVPPDWVATAEKAILFLAPETPANHILGSLMEVTLWQVV